MVRTLENIVLITRSAAGCARGRVFRALRGELLKQSRVARVGFRLGDEVVPLSPDVSHCEHRGFG